MAPWCRMAKGDMDRPPSRWFFFLPFGSLALAQSQAPSPGDLFLLVLLLALSAFFSASETAFTTLYPWKVRELAETQGGPFRLLSQDITRFLTTILVGNNLVNIAATALVTDLATRAFGSAGVGLATGLMTFLILFFGEITPKSIAVHHAVPLARVAAWPIYLFSILLYPVGRFFSLVSGFFLRVLGLEPRDTPLVSERELKLILAGAEESGIIEAQEEEMIHSILELEETPVREIMTPRVEMVAIEAEASLEDFLHLFREHRYSRVPVYKESVDHIVGVAYAQDLLDYYCEEDLKGRTVASIAHPPYFVPENLDAWSLLRELRRRKVHMAIVVDEYGGISGLVTFEDLIEEIVGKIEDEFDEDDGADNIAPVSAERWRINAATEIEDINRYFETDFSTEEADTIGGLVIHELGHLPVRGEKAQIGSLLFTVARADSRRLHTLMATRIKDSKAA